MVASKMRNSRLACASLLLVPTFLVASCGPAPDGTGDEAIITIQPEGGIRTLVADGVSVASLVVRAFAADGSRDESSVTITATGGTLTSTQGTVDADGRRLVSEAPDGQVTLDFMCEAFTPGSITIRAENANASTSITIECVQPTGALELIADKSACDINLVADGTSRCRVVATVNARASGQRIPRPGATVAVAIDTLSNVVLPDGSPGAETDAIRQVLSADGNALALVDSLSIVMDENGQGSFYVHSPLIFFRETVNLSLSGNDLELGALPTVPVAVTIRPFDNNTNLTLAATATQVVGGDTVTLTLGATNQAGVPADRDNSDQDYAQVTINDADASLDNGAGGTGQDVNVDFQDGAATVTLTTPALDALDPPRDIVVTAFYRPVTALPAISKTLTISVNPEGALLVNIGVTYGPDDDGNPATTILSDDNTSATITVDLQKDGAPVNYPVRFQVRDADAERIGFGTRSDTAFNTLGVYEPPLDVSGNAVFATPTNGSINTVVSSQTNRIRGAAVVVVYVNDTVEGTIRSYETIVNVDRAPILQSLVFTGASPEALGALGTAVPSSAVVSFQVFDDLNQPMSNVPVSFRLPDSADPQASVLASDLSAADGSVSTVLSAGTQVGPLAVIATAQFDGVTLTVQSAPIPVTGGLPSFANSYVVCDSGGVISRYPIEAKCQLVLADRFTNATPELSVQFRAEGGNITPVVNGGEDATFVSGSPGRSSPDVLVWSYGIDVPQSFELTAGPGSVLDVAGCYDASTATPCNLHAICAEGDNPYYCPLPLDVATGNGCWESIPKLGLALTGADIEGCTLNVNGADMEVQCGADGAVTVPGGATRVGNGQPLVNFLTYYTTPAVTAAVDAVRAEELRCGYPVSCLTGQRDGFAWTDTDDCKMAPGCFDLTGATNCSHDGLLTVMASVRGEESFVDGNGNGQFDFTDANGNGVHDPGETSEAFTDLPEPFLDKNDNCFFDDFDQHPRKEPFEEVRDTDQFSDEDNSGNFGYGPTAAYSNGRWDVDKQIMFPAHLLGLVSGPILRYGEYCTSADAALGPGGYVCDNGLTATCYEVFNGYGLANCTPARVVDPALIAQTAIRDNAYANDVAYFTFQYTWTDAIGNVHNEGFTQTATLAAEEGLEVFGDTGVNLIDYTYGIGTTGGGVTNVRRPWCDDFPNLNPGLATALIGAKCDGATEQVTLAKVSAGHSAGTKVDLVVSVVCGVCGDGYLSGDEACDPAIPTGQPGFDAACTADCTIEGG